MVLLIGGHPRSGTTLLRNLCHGHPEMTVTNELGSFSEPGRRYWTYGYSMLRRWSNVKDRWAFDSSLTTGLPYQNLTHTHLNHVGARSIRYLRHGHSRMSLLGIYKYFGFWPNT